MLLVILVACGGARLAPAGKRGVADCKTLLAHITKLAAIDGGGPANAKAAGSHEALAFINERCADPKYLAYVNHLDDTTTTCLMRAEAPVTADACYSNAERPPERKPTACPAVALTQEGKATIRGAVRTAKGETFAGATVFAISGTGNTTGTTVTDEQGAFTLPEQTPDQYLVRVLALDMETEQPCVNANGGASVTVDLRLPK